jgi:hypothetical protein
MFPQTAVWRHWPSVFCNAPAGSYFGRKIDQRGQGNIPRTNDSGIDAAWTAVWQVVGAISPCCERRVTRWKTSVL